MQATPQRSGAADVVAGTQGTTVGLAPFWVWLFLALLGVACALAAIVYASKLRAKPLALAQAIGGGGIASTVIAGLSTRIAGLPVQLTWFEAAIFTGSWFLLGMFFWLGVVWAAVARGLIGPLKNRFGRVQGTRAWVEFFGGVDSFRAWIHRTVRAIDADEAWDEFSCAAHEVHRSIDSAPEDTDVAMRVLEKALRILPQSAPPRAVSTIDAIRLVRARLERPVETLAARLAHTTFNFTVWRIHESDTVLEHLASFPMETGHEVGRPQKRALPIWTDSTKSDTASLAGHALLRREYVVLTQSSCPKTWEKRGLGSAYDAVGCMPIPCNPQAPPWGVVCVEIREGSIPLASNAVRLLMAKLSNAIDRVGTAVRKRGIDDVIRA